MALIYFYDSTELDRKQTTAALEGTDHRWEYVEEKISLENLNPETEVISVFVTSTVTREIIERLPNLKLIACRSTGFNTIDLAAAEDHGITVTNVPTYGEATVAEYAFTLLLALTRKLQEVLETENEQYDQTKLQGQDLSGKTLGVIGGGHIGQHSIKIGNGFSMRVVVYDAHPRQDLAETMDFEYVDLDELLKQSDFVTIHAPYLPSTHHLMNAEKFDLMKESAILINTARGEIVDTGALVEALNSGRLGGAAIDVVEGEVMLNHHEEVALLRSQEIPSELLRHGVEISLLKKMPNVIISPHNAFNTVEAVERINNTTAQNIIEFWHGNIPNKVKPPEKSRGRLIITRHAESEWNATGQWSGTSDVHLSDKGFRETVMLAGVLKSLNIQLDSAYCSEQIRSRETLEGILNASQQFNVNIIHTPAINERDYGKFTGMNKWDLEKLLGEEKFDDIRRGWDVPIPEGETLKMVYERVVPFYKDVIMPQINSGKNILIVAHGNSIRSLMKYIENIPDNEIEHTDMIFGTMISYDVDEDGHLVDKNVFKIDSPPPNA